MNRIVVSGPAVAVIRITPRSDGLQQNIRKASLADRRPASSSKQLFAFFGGHNLRGVVTRRSLDHVRVENSILLEIMRNGVLSEKRRLQSDFGADPFALRMRGIGGMVASAAAAELRSEASTLNLIELPNLAPRSIAGSAGNVDF